MVDAGPGSNGSPRGRRGLRTGLRRKSNLSRAQRRRLRHTLRQLRPRRQLIVKVRGIAGVALLLAVLVPWLLGVAVLARLAFGQ